jgi:chorismate dehydratase
LKIRISLVDYLNSAPLGWAFLHGPFKGKFTVIPSSPARCADQLAGGEADIGLIPSIEYQRMPDLQIIPEISISSLRKVRSILLVRRRGANGINSVALDSSSRTSAALAKILLHIKMGVQAEFISHAPDLSVMLKHHDAAMLIGDAALKVPVDDYDVLDLAEAWTDWQQRPFVCAFWACRSGVLLPDDLKEIFREATEWGLKARSEIASIYSKRLKLPQDFLEKYLYENINYEMGPLHLEGLNRFYELSKQEGLISVLDPLHFL